MVKAFKCERCGSYGDGNGRNVIIDTGHDKSLKYDYDKEVCDECAEQLENLIEEWMKKID